MPPYDSLCKYLFVYYYYSYMSGMLASFSYSVVFFSLLFQSQIVFHWTRLRMNFHKNIPIDLTLYMKTHAKRVMCEKSLHFTYFIYRSDKFQTRSSDRNFELRSTQWKGNFRYKKKYEWNDVDRFHISMIDPTANSWMIENSFAKAFRSENC